MNDGDLYNVVLHTYKHWAVADVAPHPSSDQIIIDFMQFSGNFNKIVSLRPQRVGVP